MSATNSLHYQLCLEGAKWLHRKKSDWKKCQNKDCHVLDPNKGEFGEYVFCKQCRDFPIVAVELVVVGAADNPDVWGFNGYITATIEVKTSHADFLADKKKWGRREEASKYSTGNLRWFLCPEGVIKPEELPEGWGLLYWDGKRIRFVVAAVQREGVSWGDMRMLWSLMRREEFPKKVYNYRGAPTTIKPKR